MQNLNFAPAADTVGTFYLEFVVSDSGANDDDGDDTTNKNSITESLEILILNFNDTPELPTTAITFDSNGVEDTAFTFTAEQFLEGVIDQDFTYDVNGEYVSNPFGDVLSISNLSATNGTVTGPVNGVGTDVYTFTPDENFNGLVTFNYLINDGQGGSIANTVTRTVDAVNDSPEATFDIPQFASEDTGTLNGQLTASDIEISRGELVGEDVKFRGTNIISGLTIDDDGSFAFDTSHADYNYLALNEQLILTVNYEVYDDILLRSMQKTTPTLKGHLRLH